ncbi:expression library immunization antigen 1 [Paramyrothecium foliicola]|nr:expression library immunization antigen 1 [Paramyrothecium foliicola]
MFVRTSTACLLMLASCAQAHFKLVDPESIGFSDDEEGTAPCGSFTPNFSKDKIADFHVGGQPIALLSTHPEGTWLFRATFEESAKGDWQQIHSIVTQKGLGDFCVPAVTAPDSWVGRTGVLGVVIDAPDGMLYQCASVRFVEGEQAPGSSCKNGTDVTGTVSQDDKLAELASATITPPASSSTGSPASSTSADSDSAGTPSMSVSYGVILGAVALLCAGYGL